jgi:hypothetical protein
MPSINTASVPVFSFPNLFVSPFGNDGVIPLYSSIPIDERTSSSCLPCVVCGNSNVRAQVVAAEAMKVPAIVDDSVRIDLSSI